MSKSTQTPSSVAKADVYARVTSRIVADLENGGRPWMKPWRARRNARAISRPLRFNRAPYRGVNVLLLWGEAIDKGYLSSVWMTYRQAEEVGGQVRKGETGTLVVFADRFTCTRTDEHGEEQERTVPFLKGYTVFNVEQIDGLPERLRVVQQAAPTSVLLHQAAEQFMARTGAEVRHGGDRAYYAPGPDVIQLPPVDDFSDAQSYTATKAHELIHWTGHPQRLAREFGKRFGDSAYAFEELVAELGSAFLCADLGVTPEVREDHAAYLGHWLSVLKGDRRAIFTAATHAQRAVDYLHTQYAG